MKIADLFISETEETFAFRGETFYVVVTPDVYTMSDLRTLDEESATSIAGFLLKGVKEFGIKRGEESEPLAAIKERKKKVPEITEEFFTNGCPIALTRRFIIRIQALWDSAEGKPNSPKS